MKLTCKHCEKVAAKEADDDGSNAVLHLDSCRAAKEKFPELDGFEDESWALEQFIQVDDRTFYKTLFTVTVLSDEPLPDGADFGNILAEMDDGPMIGDVSQGSSKPRNYKQIVKDLKAVGNDGEFFDQD